MIINRQGKDFMPVIHVILKSGKNFLCLELLWPKVINFTNNNNILFFNKMPVKNEK